MPQQRRFEFVALLVGCRRIVMKSPFLGCNGNAELWRSLAKRSSLIELRRAIMCSAEINPISRQS
jgi:hypothetical protein